MRLDAGLEDEQAGRTVGIGRHFYAVHRDRTRHLVRAGNHVAQEFHRAANAHVATRADAEYREHAPCHQTGADTGTHVVLAQ